MTPLGCLSTMGAPVASRLRAARLLTGRWGYAAGRARRRTRDAACPSSSEGVTGFGVYVGVAASPQTVYG